MDIHRQIVEKREAGETFAVAVIVRTAGSSPRDVGARMLVNPDGSISGTIGGGKFEKLVIDDCVALFSEGRFHLLKTYRFASSGPDATGMSCGGEADVFMEIFARPDRLLVFGGGHVGKELVRIAEALDFRITVVDDRKDILEQYHEPIETVLTDAEYVKEFPSVDRNTYVVILTRSHSCDRAVLKRVIGEDVAYIGMIGSKRKISETFSLLKEGGTDESLFSKVHAPIGLDVGAEGPGEIAVAVAAELVATRRKSARSRDAHFLTKTQGK